MFKKILWIALGISLLLPSISFASNNSLSEFINQWVKEVNFTNWEFSGWFLLRDGETAEEAEKRFYEEHNKFLNLQLDTTRKALSDKSTPEIERKMHQDFLQELKHARSAAIVFTPTPNHDIHKEQNSITHKARSDDAKNSPSSVRFWPFKWGFDINRTYISNSFYFNTVAAFNADRTYEHETQVYDTNFANFGGYWNSNMPYAYHDTQFMDNGNIDNFAIGSSNTAGFMVHKNIWHICP